MSIWSVSRTILSRTTVVDVIFLILFLHVISLYSLVASSLVNFPTVIFFNFTIICCFSFVSSIVLFVVVTVFSSIILYMLHLSQNLMKFLVAYTLRCHSSDKSANLSHNTYTSRITFHSALFFIFQCLLLLGCSSEIICCIFIFFLGEIQILLVKLLRLGKHLGGTRSMLYKLANFI